MTFVYVMAVAGKTKVGISVEPKVRMETFRHEGGHADIAVEYLYAAGSDEAARAIERGVHEALSRYRVVGEWFSCSSAVAVTALEGFLLDHIRRQSRELITQRIEDDEPRATRGRGRGGRRRSVVRVKGFQIFEDRHGRTRCYHRASGAPIDLVRYPLGTAGFFAECQRVVDAALPPDEAMAGEVRASTRAPAIIDRAWGSR